MTPPPRRRRTPLAKYRCPHCKRVMRRASTKQWFKSYCDKTDRWARLQRVKT